MSPTEATRAHAEAERRWVRESRARLALARPARRRPLIAPRSTSTPTAVLAVQEIP